MPAYEAMFIFKPGLKEEEQKALAAEMENVLKTNEAKIESSQVFGKRHLAYEIKKQKEGLYYLITFSTVRPEVISKLKQACKVNENILRALIVRKK